MNGEKTVISAVVICTLAALIIAVKWMPFGSGTPNTVKASVNASQIAQEVEVACEKTAACGWSTLDSPRDAVKEAVAMVRKRLGGRSPSFALVASTTGYDMQVVFEEVRKGLGDQVKLQGVTSGTAVMTNEGLHRGKVGSIGILAVASESIRFGTGWVSFKDYPTLRAAGVAGIKKAIADAGRKEGDRPNIVLMNGEVLRGGENEVMDGIADVVGKDVPVIGGSAAEDDHTGVGALFTREGVYNTGVVISVIYTRLKTGWAFESGFRITDKGGFVTKCDSRNILEIDHRPALDVYNEWLNGRLLDVLKTRSFSELIQFTAYNPLCNVLKGKDGQTGYVVVHAVPTKENLVDKAVPVYAQIENGSRINLYAGTWQTILNRAEALPTKAMLCGEMLPDEAGFGIVIFCHGAFASIPESETLKIPLLVRNSSRNIPFLGIITNGEQGPLPGVRNVDANLVESMIIVAK